MHLDEFLTSRLQNVSLELKEFRELLVRLLNYGVLHRAESLIEQQMYDRYVRAAPVVEEYLEQLGIRLFHDTRLEYVRLYPPGAHLPGMDDAHREAYGGSLRRRLNQAEVALILVLRAQYDKAIREGRVDQNGAVAESLESLIIAMKNLLGRNLPDKLTERRKLLQRLRQLRLIDYRQEVDLDNPETWLKIYPMITDFVSEEALAVLQVAGELPPETPGDTPN